MKINKNNKLQEQVELDKKIVEDVEESSSEDIAIDDILDASVSEIADAVQDAAEEASNGEETYSDTKAKAIANEIKTYAKGFDAAAWAPLDVANELTDKLDDCLANALVGHHMGTNDGTDLLVTGLPGSGKTGITKQWAKDRGINLCYVNAKDPELEAILNGFPMPIDDVDGETGKAIKSVDRAYSKSLDKLKRPRSVLFLDEFNRAPHARRASLLTLINEHAVSGPGDDGYYTFKDLLFTVACINPASQTDPGAELLNDAESSRFVDTIPWNSKVPEAIKYIRFHLKKLLGALKPEDEHYNFLYTRYTKILNLAEALLGDPLFEFDSEDDTFELSTTQKKMLNQRSITDALMAHGYNKNKFLQWVDKFSNFLDKDKEMIHSILDSWVEPEVALPGNGANSVQTAEAPAEETGAAANADSDDFDSVFGTEGEEADDDLFTSTASNAGKAARVSAADALNRIKAFDFSL